MPSVDTPANGMSTQHRQETSKTLMRSVGRASRAPSRTHGPCGRARLRMATPSCSAGSARPLSDIQGHRPPCYPQSLDSPVRARHPREARLRLAALGGVAAQAALVHVRHLQADQPRAQRHILVRKAVQDGPVAPDVARHGARQAVDLRRAYGARALGADVLWAGAWLARGFRVY